MYARDPLDQRELSSRRLRRFDADRALHVQVTVQLMELRRCLR